MLKPGTQIAYIPSHAEGNIEHPDVEFGFVTGASSNSHHHFCRYWRKGSKAALRTTANSECTPDEYLVEHEYVPQGVVNRTMVALGYMFNVHKHQKGEKRHVIGT